MTTTVKKTKKSAAKLKLVSIDLYDFLKDDTDTLYEIVTEEKIRLCKDTLSKCHHKSTYINDRDDEYMKLSPSEFIWMLDNAADITEEEAKVLEKFHIVGDHLDCYIENFVSDEEDGWGEEDDDDEDED